MNEKPPVTQLDVTATSALARSVLDEVENAVVGKRDALTLILCGILAGGHVLIEDLPGLGKTLAARSFAQTLGLQFTRAQFTPDLLPADLTGSYLYDQSGKDFVFRKGPVFTQLLLADEINRTPPKTQAALLEAMQERQVTVEGETHKIEAPFHVLATSNPIEYEGTYPLPEAQLDRFILRTGFGYATQTDECEILIRRMERQTEEQHLTQIVNSETLLAMQAAVETVSVDADLVSYCVDLARATRVHSHIAVGASPRGALALMLCARAHAVIVGRDFATPEDIKMVAVSALAHRLTINPELWLSDASSTKVVNDVLSEVPTPAPEGSK